MAGLELPEQRDQLVAVVLGVRHQVAAAHIEPFDPVEVLVEVFFDGFERQPQVVRTRLAEHVEMQTVDSRRQLLQEVGRNAQTRTRNAGVVEVGLDGRILGIDTQSARNAAQQGHRSETLELGDGIEGDMVAAAKYLFDIAVGIDRGVGMGGAAELLENKTRFGGGRGRRAVAVAGQFGKDAPHGAGLQSHDNFSARFAAHTVDYRQITVQQLFVEDVTRRRQFQEVNHRVVLFQNSCKNSNFPAKTARLRV